MDDRLRRQALDGERRAVAESDGRSNSVVDLGVAEWDDRFD
jgi:hypothetical protein